MWDHTPSLFWFEALVARGLQVTFPFQKHPLPAHLPRAALAQPPHIPPPSEPLPVSCACAQGPCGCISSALQLQSSPSSSALSERSLIQQHPGISKNTILLAIVLITRHFTVTPTPLFPLLRSVIVKTLIRWKKCHHKGERMALCI